MPKLARILRYPVKALSAEDLERVTLSPGQALPGDRRYALALADTPWDEPHWLPREQLLNRSRFPRLGRLDARVENGRLTIRRRGRVVLNAELAAAHGRQVVSSFFAAYLAGECFGHPRLVEFGDGFGDLPRPRLSLVGSGTLDEVARLAGRRLEPDELRVNLLIDDLPPRAEQDWIGRRIRMGGAVLAITDAMERAILPELMGHTFGYARLGVWAEVAQGGEAVVGDRVVADPRPPAEVLRDGGCRTA